MIGRTIGRYRVVEELGRGGSGVVWRAQHTLIGREVALRTLHSELGASSIVRERVFEHQRLLQGLRSPAYVPVEDVIRGKRGLAMVSALRKEPTLDEILVSGPMPLDLALSLAGDLAHLLASAHEVGVVHGAIGPSRVRWSEEGGKLLDLGLGSAVLAARGHAVLRPHASDAWRAPEVARGSMATSRSDVYSFGAVLLHALSTGGPAAAQRDPGDVLDEWGVQAPAWLIGVLRRCLKQDADVRFPDMRPVLAALDAQGFAPELPELPEFDDADEVTEVLGGTSAVSALAPGAPRPKLRSPRKGAPESPANVLKVRGGRRKAPAPRRPEEALGMEPLNTEEEPLPTPISAAPETPATYTPAQSAPPRRKRSRGASTGGSMVAGLGVATVMSLVFGGALLCAGGAWFLVERNKADVVEGIAVEASLYVENKTPQPVDVTCTQQAGEQAGVPLPTVTIAPGEAGKVPLSMLPADCQGIDADGQQVLDWSAEDPYPEQGWALVARVDDVAFEAAGADDVAVEQDSGTAEEEEEAAAPAVTSTRGGGSSSRRRRSTPKPEEVVVEEAPAEMASLTVVVDSSKRKFQDEVDIYIDELRMGEMRVSTKVPVGQHNVRVAKPGKGEAACVVYVPPEGISFELDPAAPRCP